MESVLKYLDWTSVGLALLVGLLSLLLLELFRWNSFRSQSPPGPKSLPFVGNLPQFSKDQMGIIRSLPKYGEMCSIFLGRKPTIVLNNMQLAKEAFVQNGTVFSGRPLLPLQAWLTKGYGIILANYGHSWRQQRRFALHTLRDFGLGKKTVEERVAEEAHYLIKEMLKQEDRFEYNDKRFAKLLEILNESIRLGGTTMAQEELKEDTTFHVENMMKSVFDLFIAGTETTATTLRWGLVYMMNHPDVQERCHEEIIRVLGFDRSPCMEDRAQLPYTHATVYEIQRYASITPLGLIHQTTEPALLRGYHLPKGSTIMVNLKAIMTDKQHWKYPDTFNPENFLDEKGQFCRNDAFLPFSLALEVLMACWNSTPKHGWHCGHSSFSIPLQYDLPQQRDHPLNQVCPLHVNGQHHPRRSSSSLTHLISLNKNTLSSSFFLLGPIRGKCLIHDIPPKLMV
ncbi:cytochrome P450 2H1-like isoform X1 [Pygocentrus nattereri]|uniref:cytochrome P450 2H1-like isoform X1 n=1 Tax=Pygocentrus nattereri TaxID=42514 RepID=UPI00189104D5|nr:cytochrome P450 2H1-like isoform X1 [Pygocentrus nattereri]